VYEEPLQINHFSEIARTTPFNNTLLQICKFLLQSSQVGTTALLISDCRTAPPYSIQGLSFVRLRAVGGSLENLLPSDPIHEATIPFPKEKFVADQPKLFRPILGILRLVKQTIMPFIRDSIEFGFALLEKIPLATNVIENTYVVFVLSFIKC
jgi:hypothetical protein